MTYSEAEGFIETVISPGEVMVKYKGKTLKEALEDYCFRDSIDMIANYADLK